MLASLKFGKLAAVRRLLIPIFLTSAVHAAADPLAIDAWLYAPAPQLETPAAQPRQSPPMPFPSSDTSRSAWIQQADFLRPRLAAMGLRIGDPIHLRIFKQSRELELWIQGADGYVLYRNFPICDVSGTLGPKRFEGDFQAPEGFYSVARERLHPHSEFHLAFNLGYPNEFDRALGRTGSNIMIHGSCASNGCFAMTDYYMEQIYMLTEAALRGGQPAVGVEIYPFRMTDENLTANADSSWAEFWRSLRPAHDHFLEHRVPARIAVGAFGYRALTQDEAAGGAASDTISAP